MTFHIHHRFLHSSNQTLSAYKNPSDYVLKVSKKTNEHGEYEIHVEKKGIWTYIKQYFYSGKYSYQLSKIKDIFEKNIANVIEENPGELESCITIFNTNVIDHASSFWTLIFGSDTPMNTFHLPAAPVCKEQPSQILPPPSLTAPPAPSIKANEKTGSSVEAPPLPPEPIFPEPILQLPSSTSPALTSAPEPSQPPIISVPLQAVKVEDSSSAQSKDGLMPFVPKNGISVGLPNIDETGLFGNTCWLNSILKFISSGYEFDEMLTKTTPPAMNPLREEFRTIVKILRTGKTQDGQEVAVVPEEIYQKFLSTLKQTIPACSRGIPSQQGAQDFIYTFAEALRWAPVLDDERTKEQINAARNFPRFALEFIPSQGTPKDKYKYHSQGHALPYAIVNIPSSYLKNSKPLDLEELLGKKEKREVSAENSEQFPNPMPNRTPKLLKRNYLFDTTVKGTCWPKTFLLGINRAVISDDPMQQIAPQENLSKVQNPIKVDKDGLITLIEYTPVLDNFGNIASLKPSHRCRYRIDTAIQHLGVGDGGHYICLERASDGQMIKHDDETLSPLSNGISFGTTGVFLRLTRVSYEPIQSKGQVLHREEGISHQKTQQVASESEESLPFQAKKEPSGSQEASQSWNYLSAVVNRVRSALFGNWGSD